jgi:hypothetical protein
LCQFGTCDGAAGSMKYSVRAAGFARTCLLPRASTRAWGQARTGCDSAKAKWRLFRLCSNGVLYAWGDNSSGAVGSDSIAGLSLVPAAVQGVPSGVQSVAAGTHFVCALSGGEVWRWGTNNSGQLGNAGTGSVVPSRVLGLPAGVEAIAAGDMNFRCARRHRVMRPHLPGRTPGMVEGTAWGPI